MGQVVPAGFHAFEPGEIRLVDRPLLLEPIKTRVCWASIPTQDVVLVLRVDVGALLVEAKGEKVSDATDDRVLEGLERRDEYGRTDEAGTHHGRVEEVFPGLPDLRIHHGVPNTRDKLRSPMRSPASSA